MITSRHARSAIRVERLQSTSLFSNCTKGELRQIASITTTKDVAAGSVLAYQGTAGREFFIVMEGSATATRNGQVLARLGPGSFFGELALLDGGRRTATVVADTAMALLVLTRSEFTALQYTAPSVARKILIELGSRMRHTYELHDGPSEAGTAAVPQTQTASL